MPLGVFTKRERERVDLYHHEDVSLQIDLHTQATDPAVDLVTNWKWMGPTPDPPPPLLLPPTPDITERTRAGDHSGEREERNDARHLAETREVFFNTPSC